MTWIDGVLDRKHRDRRLKDRDRQRQDAENEANISLSWRAWPEAVDEIERAVEYFNEHVKNRDKILLTRDNQWEIMVSYRRRPSLRLILHPESRAIECETVYRQRGWESDTLYLARRFGGFALIARNGKRGLRRTIKQRMRKFLEDIVL